MFCLACGGKRSKLLFNIIKIIIISFTYANPGRKKRAFQSTRNKILSQTVRLPCDFSCDYKLAQENNPNCRKIMTLFNADALSAHPFCQFFPAYCFSLSIVLLLASVLKLLENGFPPAAEPPTDTHTPPSWGSNLGVPNWISALQEHRVIGINVLSEDSREARLRARWPWHHFSISTLPFWSTRRPQSLGSVYLMKSAGEIITSFSNVSYNCIYDVFKW